MKPTAAFTLIELLVVVTIIIVLLALLTPALDKAIYQSELAVCGTRLHGIGAGVFAYASDFQRRYPYRPGVHELTRGVWSPELLYGGADPLEQGDEFDDRRVICDRISLKLLLCPLTPSVDLANTRVDSHVYSSFCLWYGWAFAGPNGGPGMFKLGDRFAYGGERFSVLANDWDRIDSENRQSLGDHPDTDGQMVNVVRQDQNATNITLGVGAISQVISYWQILSDFKRGPVDSNALFDDGSVRRYDRVTWDETQPGGRGRMRALPEFVDGQHSPGWWVHAPKP